MSAYGWMRGSSLCGRGPQDLLEGLDGRLGLVLANVRRALEQLGLDVELAVRRDGLEQLDGLLEVPLLVVELAEQEVELVAHLLERRLIELGAVVLSDLLEDAGRIGQLARQRREPLQGRVVVGVRRALLNDAIEVRQRRRVVLHVVEGLAHPELGLLLVRLAVARLAFDDLAELDRRRVVVLAVVQLERALEHLGRLIADRRLALWLRFTRLGCCCFLLLGRGHQIRKGSTDPSTECRSRAWGSCGDLAGCARKHGS